MEILRSDDIATCLALRRIVFIDEQGVSEDRELDDLDGEAIHLLARKDGHPLGSARLLIRGNTGKIGRVCVLQQARGMGLGKSLILAAIAEFRGMDGLRQVKLSSQNHAVGFYEALGFTAIGEIYDDAGIAHRDMILPL
ncbi:MAG: GNAT family N-acetyltransferase [Pseudorhodobacter sp.]